MTTEDNVYMQKNVDVDENDNEEAQTSRSRSSSDTTAQSSRSIAKLLDEIQSADDVRLNKNHDCDIDLGKKTSKDGMSWQCLSELPSIQTMTNFLLNTCHNYRQTMKAVLSGKHTYAFEDGKCNGDTEINDKTNANEKNKDECGTSRESTSNRKRGRPPKSGTSKKMKRYKVIDLYTGKLTDLISADNESEPDYLLW